MDSDEGRDRRRVLVLRWSGSRLPADRRSGVDVAGHRRMAGGIRGEQRLQVGIEHRRITQRRRPGVGIALHDAVREHLEEISAHQRIAGVTCTHRARAGDDAVVIHAAGGVAVAARVIDLRQAGARGHVARGEQPVVHLQSVLMDRGVEEGRDPGAVQQLRDRLRTCQHGLEVEVVAARIVHQVARLLADQAVGLTMLVDADQQPVIGEHARQRLPRESPDLAGAIARQRQGRTVETTAVAAVTHQENRVERRSLVERGTQARIVGVRVIVDALGPLLHVQPLSGRRLIVVNAVLDGGGNLAQRHADAVEVAVIALDDVERVDVRVHQPREHEATLRVLHPGVRADQRMYAVRIADVGQPALPDRQRRGQFRTGRGVDSRVDQHEVRGRRRGRCARERPGHRRAPEHRQRPPGLQ